MLLMAVGLYRSALHGSNASEPADVHWQKFADFTLPHLYLAPPLGLTPFEFRKDFWHQKTIESLGYRAALFA